MPMRKQRSARVAVPIGMSLIVCGLSLNSISLLVARAAHTPHGGQGMSDFLHGFLMGLGIALEIAGLVVMLTAARCATRPERSSSQGGKG